MSDCFVISLVESSRRGSKVYPHRCSTALVIVALAYILNALTSLLGCNSPTTQSPHLQRTQWGFLGCYRILQPSPQSILEHLVTSTRNPVLATSSPSLALRPCFSIDPLFWAFTRRESTLGGLCDWLLSLATRGEGQPCCNWSVHTSRLLMRAIPRSSRSSHAGFPELFSLLFCLNHGVRLSRWEQKPCLCFPWDCIKFVNQCREQWWCLSLQEHGLYLSLCSDFLCVPRACANICFL